MSSYSNDLEERRRVSKVTFSPISSHLLVVRIRKVSSEIREEDIPKMASDFRPISKSPANRREGEKNSKCTVTDSLETASISSQTTHKEQTNAEASLPCLRHATENISRKAIDIPTEKISMCNNCSKSMLSYIFLVQDFLDSLAKEISGSETSRCLQCARQEVRDSISSLDATSKNFSNSESGSRIHSENKSNQSEPKQKDLPNARHGSKRTSRAKGHRQDSKRNEDYQKGLVSSHQSHANQQRQQSDFIYNVSSPPSIIVQDEKLQNVLSVGGEKRVILDQPSFEDQASKKQQTFLHDQNVTDNQSINQKGSDSFQVINESMKKTETNQDDCVSHYENGISQQTEGRSSEKSIFNAPMERLQPNYDTVVPVSSYHQKKDDNNLPVLSPTLFRDDDDGIISTLSTVEREIYDSERNTAGWEVLTESQERFGLPPSNFIVSEAFVTACRNNAEAIGCLAVGTSLLLCRTSRTLCVLVSEGVSAAFRTALSSVFQVVQFVRSLDSLGTTKLALLEQPELGITFEKLNVWRLTQFTKCVYLNPDTLVIQNCDELFCREELSAVPDIGWPDCFNSGVFVYSPSIHTFWKLLEFAEKQGSYDGGDQGLLNSYFPCWSSDINKKLSFIYNLMANVSYTYTPAFRQFGRDVKIVQFHGSFKPWHVKFFSKTGQISPSSPVHPTYVQFVHIWLSIFRISVLRLMPQDIQCYAATQETICAVEILRFFPLAPESQTDFFLTPPSVRVRLAEIKLNRSCSLPISEARRRKSAEFFRYPNAEDDISPEANTSQTVEIKNSEIVDVSKNNVVDALNPEVSKTDDQTKEKLEEHVLETYDVFNDAKAAENEEVKDKNALPGAEVGDYQGMRAWEQGRMDYQGDASSDNVIKRLEFLMSRPN